MKISELPELLTPAGTAQTVIIEQGVTYRTPLPSGGGGGGAVDIGFAPTLTGRQVEVATGVWKPTKIVRVLWPGSLGNAGDKTAPHNLPNVDTFISCFLTSKNNTTHETITVGFTFVSGNPLRFSMDRVNMRLGATAVNLANAGFTIGFAIAEYYEL